jgi:hypothetical protein
VAKAGVDHELAAAAGTGGGDRLDRNGKRILDRGFKPGRRPPELLVRLVHHFSHSKECCLGTTQANSQIAPPSNLFPLKHLRPSNSTGSICPAQLLLALPGKDSPDRTILAFGLLNYRMDRGMLCDFVL